MLADGAWLGGLPEIFFVVKLDLMLHLLAFNQLGECVGCPHIAALWKSRIAKRFNEIYVCLLQTVGSEIP